MVIKKIKATNRPNKCNGSFLWCLSFWGKHTMFGISYLQYFTSDDDLQCSGAEKKKTILTTFFCIYLNKIGCDTGT